MQIGTFDAKNKLSALLDKVEAGEEITITRNGKPVAKLVSVQPADDRRAKAIEAARGILEMRKQVKPDPEGLTARDYIEIGRRS